MPEEMLVEEALNFYEIRSVHFDFRDQTSSLIVSAKHYSITYPTKDFL